MADETEAPKAWSCTRCGEYAGTPVHDHIAELEGQLKMVLDRESATHLRHDAKTDKLEAHIAELEAKIARVIEIANLIAGRMMK